MQPKIQFYATPSRRAQVSLELRNKMLKTLCETSDDRAGLKTEKGVQW
jgi:hypothetical protein